VKIDIPENVAAFGYNPEMIIRLDASRLESLGWKAQVGIKEMFQRLVESMRIDN
jgi:nucleoside-diphosphate-sugar epimerase